MGMLPASDVKTLLKIPCPVSKPLEEDVHVFKNLRRTFEVKEETACEKCHLSKKCKDAFQPPREKTKSPVDYLVYFLLKMQSFRED